MSLTGEMLKSGITFIELKELLRKNDIQVTEKIIDDELKLEEQRLLDLVGEDTKEREKINRLYNVMKNQSIVESKCNMLELEYKYSGGNLRRGYINNLLNSGKLEENKYLMIFLFNRMKNKYKLFLEGYNEDFFKQEEEIIMKRVKAVNLRTQKENASSFKQWLKLLNEENKRRRAAEKEEKEKEKEERKIKSRQKLGKSNIDLMIADMLNNVDKAKIELKKSQPNDKKPEENIR